MSESTSKPLRHFSTVRPRCISTALTATVARGVISLRLDIAGRDSTCRTNFPRIRELLRAYGFGDIWLIGGSRRAIEALKDREGYSFSATRTVKL